MDVRILPGIQHSIILFRESKILFFKTSRQILERNPPTQFQQCNKTMDESTEPKLIIAFCQILNY
jgi:hypothetical protein